MFNMKVPIPKFLKSVKYTLIAVNSVFLLTGILLLLTGIVVLAIYSEYDELITRRFFSLPGFVIATGTIIILGSALGFYGAFTKQFYFIAGYVLILLVVLVFEVSIVIVAYALRSSATSDIRAPMLASRELYDSRREIAKLWDELHMAYECCGVTGRTDWITNRMPVSCCYIDFGTVSPFECTFEKAYPIGCAVALGEWLSYNAYVIAVTSLVVTCIQVPITAVAAWMAYKAKFQEVELES